MDTVEERIEEEQKSEQLKKEQNGIEMTIEADDVITYAIQQNGGRIVRDICLKNTTEEDIDDLLIRIDSDTDLIQMFELEIQKLRAGEELHLKEKEIKIISMQIFMLAELIQDMVMEKTIIHIPMLIGFPDSGLLINCRKITDHSKRKLRKN
mgnify:CR=1 FL=1